MKIAEPSFTLGIEEEYLIVDAATGDLVTDPPDEFFEQCSARVGPQVTNEYLRSQVEVGTSVCDSLDQARAELARLRSCVSEVAGDHGMAPIAASTHPVADWNRQRHTEKQRYDELKRDMQAVADRLLICGMHVHVAIEDPDLRIELFNQLPYFLPHLLALSTSSPFWKGIDTGLCSYRLSVFDALPRTGLPESFTSFGEYRRTLGILIGAGLVEDATKVWWDLRPSDRFPTLEMRITDVCPLLDDTIAIAGLFRCLVRMLYRLRLQNQRWRAYSRFLVNENRWRAQRYGVGDGLVDFGRGSIVPVPELVSEMLELVAEDAEAFGCADTIARATAIAAEGTSADRQRTVYATAKEGGADDTEAFRAVATSLIRESVHGVRT